MCALLLLQASQPQLFRRRPVDLAGPNVKHLQVMLVAAVHTRHARHSQWHIHVTPLPVTDSGPRKYASGCNLLGANACWWARGDQCDQPSLT